MAVILPFLFRVALPSFLIFCVAFLVASCILTRLKRRSKTIGFFHPYCNAGGGGERVLFCAVKHFLLQYPEWTCVVYTGDAESKTSILSRCRDRFGPGSCPDESFYDRIDFVHLQWRNAIEASTWPRLTLLGQALGSLLLGLEALLKRTPQVFVDSMGFAFTLPLARIVSGCHTVSYVHYPTISLDMLNRVRERRPSYNNSERIANSTVISSIKLIYYRFFAWCYGLVGGKFCQVTLVNSNWTKEHIESLWGVKTNLVYPPCVSISSPAAQKMMMMFQKSGFKQQGAKSSSKNQRNHINRKRKNKPNNNKNSSNNKKREYFGDEDDFFNENADEHEVSDDEYLIEDDEAFREDNLVVSVGQFRPEKDHRLQLKSIAEYKKLVIKKKKAKALKLIMIGSCRNKEDLDRVDELRAFAVNELGLSEGSDFAFALSVSKSELDLYMDRALIGIHTMWNEHFGIGIVEMMQRGCIVVAHNSGGPRVDIVANGTTGYLASDEHEFASVLDRVANEMSENEKREMRRLAKLSILRFTEDEFGKLFLQAINGKFPFLKSGIKAD